MPNIRTLQRSFAGGEVSPEMYGRIDDAKYQAGAATMRNFIAKPQGPAENRPGFAYVNEVKDSTKKTRLIPFTFNTTQTMVIEMGAGYFRFHTQGGTLQPGSAPAYQSGQNATISIASPGVVTVMLNQFADGTPVAFTTTGALPTGITAGTRYYTVNGTSTTFQLATTVGGTPINTSGTQSGTHNVQRYYSVGDLVSYTGNTYYCIANGAGNTPPNATYWYPLTSAAYEIPNPYAEADIFDIHYVQSADVLTLVHPNYPPKELRRLGATKWMLTDITFGSAASTPTGVTAVASGHTSAKYTYYYKVTAVASDLVSESAPSTAASASGNLLETGGIVTISWTSNGASLYNVYKLQGGIYGYIGQTSGTSIIDDNISPDMSVAPPTYDTVFASSGNYPGAVSYFEQRRTFAGTTNDPQTIWMTKSGTESNMSYSLPIKDDDRIKFRVNAREANTIRHIVPLTQLLLLTSSAEWRVTSVNSDAITPSSISVRPQSYVGSSNVQPVLINNTLIYEAARGGHVRECGYSWQANGFVTGDMSIRASHLFDTYNLIDMAYAKAPTPIVWTVSNSGKLLGLTYIPEQQIGAWHWHDTDGIFESCAVVAEGTEDVLYVVVKRTINGSSKRFVERMATRAIDDPAKAFFVDCGASYDGTNTGATTATITGTGYTPEDTLTIFMSASTFTYPGTANVGDAIVLTDASGNKYRVTITSVLAVNEALGRVDVELPASLQNTATTSWALAIKDVSGLSHIEGKTVNILADGAVQPQQVVTSGVVSIPRAAVKIQVGLPITADLQTLPVAMQIDNGFGQGRMKNVNKAWLRVYLSSGIFIGPDENHLVEAKQRTTEPYGTAPALKSQEILVMTTPSWADSGQVFIRQTDPLPLTIASLTLEIAIGS